MTQTVADQSHRTRMLTLKLRPKPAGSVAEHRRIAGAIREGNAVEAHDYARRHRVRARDELIPPIKSGIRHLLEGVELKNLPILNPVVDTCMCAANVVVHCWVKAQ